MTITVELNIDLRNQGFPQRIRATQADANTRVVEVSLYDGGVAWPVPDGVAAAVGYRKPDGTAGLYDKFPDGTDALTISENTITAVLAPQVLTVPGIVSAVIIMTDDSMRQLSTFPFQIYVEKNPAAGLVVSDNYINVVDAIGDLNTLVTNDKSSLVAAINEIARNNGGTISDEQIAQAVADYLAENPIEGGYPTTTEITDGSTDEEVPTAAAVRKYVGQHSGGNVDLTGYATEQYVKDYAQPKGEYLTEVPEGYAKTEDIPTKPGDIGAQPAGNYLTAVPTGYATEEFVTNKIAEAELGGKEVDLSGYAQKSELPTKVSQLENDKGYLTEHQDISGKLNASELPTAINTALAQAKASGEFDGKDGVDGQPGKDGADGAPGEKGSDGYTPVRGTDYWTEEDKTEIVQSVIEALGGNPVFGIVDEDNNIIVSGDLADGTYSVKYEMANGSTVNIGNLVLDNNVYYTVTNTLTNCTNSNSATKAAQGSAYSATIAAKSGYELKTVTVTMGGSPVTVSGGTISIASVTGNIVITAVAEEIQAAYTNLADPTSSEWVAGHRLNSSGVPTADAENVHVTNFIGPLNDGDIIYIKGMDMTSNNTMPANADKAKTAYGLAKLSAWNDGDPASNPVASTTGGQLQIEKTSTVKYWRFSGKLNGTANDVIITINEPIV